MENKTTIVVLNEELDWLSSVIEQVMRSYFVQEGHETDWLTIPAPDLSNETTTYATFVKQHNLSVYERLLLALVLTPYMRPELLDFFLIQNANTSRRFTQFGGVTKITIGGFIPTCQTFFFLISGVHKERRIEAERILNTHHALFSEGVVVMQEAEALLTRNNAVLSLNSTWLDYFVTG